MPFYQLQEHEYRYRPLGGSFTAWAPCTEKPIQVGDIEIAIGDLQVRVMAKGARPAGEILSNDSAFTLSSGGTGNNSFSYILPFNLS